MKNSKKIFIVAMSMIMIIATITPIMAYTRIDSYFTMTPDDLGEMNPPQSAYVENGILRKFYIKINSFDNIFLRIIYGTNENTVSYTVFINITYDNNILSIAPVHNINLNDVCFYLVPTINITIENFDTIYIPVYCYNCKPYYFSTDNSAIVYYSTTTDLDTLRTEYFNLGYTDGYNTGYTQGIADTAGYQSDLNLVEHCEQLIGTFVGDDYAHYITPLCLALVVILIYFLFIRWLLALVKSKNVTRVADIIVCTACIIMLVIMYAPMLDLTIHQAQTVYQIAADTVVGG